MGYRMLRLATAITAVLLLVGCSSHNPAVMPVPEPTSTPVFASDDDALAAATEAYAKYLAVSDEITADGGLNAERISDLVTLQQYESEAEAFDEYSDRKLHTQGNSAFDIVGLQRYSPGTNGSAEIGVYICVDVSGVKIMNSLNEDVTPASRMNRYPLEVEFEVSGRSPEEIKVARSETWSGTDFCH